MCFAELYVAGLLADAGWNIYFPTRDIGFDFIATKTVASGIIIRPVQVKGKYPTAGKRDVAYYGFGGWLSQLHQEMVLAIAFFTVRALQPRLARPSCRSVRFVRTAPILSGGSRRRPDFRQGSQYHVGIIVSSLMIRESLSWSRLQFPSESP